MCSASRVSAAVWQTHAAQRRSLRKRSHRKLPFERCCTDELSACVHETIRRRRADWGLGVLCCVTSMTVTRSAQLFSIRLLASAPFREAGMQFIHTNPSIQQGLGKSVGSMWADSMAVSACAIVTNHRASSYCLTSFVAFLRWLGFLGKTWVQPGGGLAVMTVIWKRYRALSTV